MQRSIAATHAQGSTQPSPDNVSPSLVPQIPFETDVKKLTTAYVDPTQGLSILTEDSLIRSGGAQDNGSFHNPAYNCPQHSQDAPLSVVTSGTHQEVTNQLNLPDQVFMVSSNSEIGNSLDAPDGSDTTLQNSPLANEEVGPSPRAESQEIPSEGSQLSSRLSGTAVRLLAHLHQKSTTSAALNLLTPTTQDASLHDPTNPQHSPSTLSDNEPLSLHLQGLSHHYHDPDGLYPLQLPSAYQPTQNLLRSSSLPQTQANLIAGAPIRATPSTTTITSPSVPSALASGTLPTRSQVSALDFEKVYDNLGHGGQIAVDVFKRPMQTLQSDRRSDHTSRLASAPPNSASAFIPTNSVASIPGPTSSTHPSPSQTAKQHLSSLDNTNTPKSSYPLHHRSSSSHLPLFHRPPRPEPLTISSHLMSSTPAMMPLNSTRHGGDVIPEADIKMTHTFNMDHSQHGGTDDNSIHTWKRKCPEADDATLPKADDEKVGEGVLPDEIMASNKGKRMGESASTDMPSRKLRRTVVEREESPDILLSSSIGDKAEQYAVRQYRQQQQQQQQQHQQQQLPEQQDEGSFKSEVPTTARPDSKVIEAVRTVVPLSEASNNVLSHIMHDSIHGDATQPLTSLTAHDYNSTSYIQARSPARLYPAPPFGNDPLGRYPSNQYNSPHQPRHPHLYHYPGQEQQERFRYSHQHHHPQRYPQHLNRHHQHYLTPLSNHPVSITTITHTSPITLTTHDAEDSLSHPPVQEEEEKNRPFSLEPTRDIDRDVKFAIAAARRQVEEADEIVSDGEVAEEFADILALREAMNTNRTVNPADAECIDDVECEGMEKGRSGIIHNTLRSVEATRSHGATSELGASMILGGGGHIVAGTACSGITAARNDAAGTSEIRVPQPMFIRRTVRNVLTIANTSYLSDSIGDSLVRSEEESGGGRARDSLYRYGDGDARELDETRRGGSRASSARTGVSSSYTADLLRDMEADIEAILRATEKSPEYTTPFTIDGDNNDRSRSSSTTNSNSMSSSIEGGAAGLAGKHGVASQHEYRGQEGETHATWGLTPIPQACQIERGNRSIKEIRNSEDGAGRRGNSNSGSSNSSSNSSSSRMSKDNSNSTQRRPVEADIARRGVVAAHQGDGQGKIGVETGQTRYEDGSFDTDSMYNLDQAIADGFIRSMNHRVVLVQNVRASVRDANLAPAANKERAAGNLGRAGLGGAMGGHIEEDVRENDDDLRFTFAKVEDHQQIGFEDAKPFIDSAGAFSPRDSQGSILEREMASVFPHPGHTGAREMGENNRGSEGNQAVITLTSGLAGVPISGVDIPGAGIADVLQRETFASDATSTIDISGWNEMTDAPRLAAEIDRGKNSKSTGAAVVGGHKDVDDRVVRRSSAISASLRNDEGALLYRTPKSGPQVHTDMTVNPTLASASSGMHDIAQDIGSTNKILAGHRTYSVGSDGCNHDHHPTSRSTANTSAENTYLYYHSSIETLGGPRAHSMAGTRRSGVDTRVGPYIIHNGDSNDEDNVNDVNDKSIRGDGAMVDELNYRYQGHDDYDGRPNLPQHVAYVAAEPSSSLPLPSSSASTYPHSVDSGLTSPPVPELILLQPDPPSTTRQVVKSPALVDSPLPPPTSPAHCSPALTSPPRRIRRAYSLALETTSCVSDITVHSVTAIASPHSHLTPSTAHSPADLSPIVKTASIEDAPTLTPSSTVRPITTETDKAIHTGITATADKPIAATTATTTAINITTTTSGEIPVPQSRSHRHERGMSDSVQVDGFALLSPTNPISPGYLSSAASHSLSQSASRSGSMGGQAASSLYRQAHALRPPSIERCIRVRDNVIRISSSVSTGSNRGNVNIVIDSLPGPLSPSEHAVLPTSASAFSSSSSSSLSSALIEFKAPLRAKDGSNSGSDVPRRPSDHASSAPAPDDVDELSGVASTERESGTAPALSASTSTYIREPEEVYHGQRLFRIMKQLGTRHRASFSFTNTLNNTKYTITHRDSTDSISMQGDDGSGNSSTMAVNNSDRSMQDQSSFHSTLAPLEERRAALSHTRFSEHSSTPSSLRNISASEMLHNIDEGGSEGGRAQLTRHRTAQVSTPPALDPHTLNHSYRHVHNPLVRQGRGSGQGGTSFHSALQLPTASASAQSSPATSHTGIRAVSSVMDMTTSQFLYHNRQHSRPDQRSIDHRTPSSLSSAGPSPLRSGAPPFSRAVGSPLALSGTQSDRDGPSLPSSFSNAGLHDRHANTIAPKRLLAQSHTPTQTPGHSPAHLRPQPNAHTPVHTLSHTHNIRTPRSGEGPRVSPNVPGGRINPRGLKALNAESSHTPDEYDHAASSLFSMRPGTTISNRYTSVLQGRVGNIATGRHQQPQGDYPSNTTNSSGLLLAGTARGNRATSSSLSGHVRGHAHHRSFDANDDSTNNFLPENSSSNRMKMQPTHDSNSGNPAIGRRNTRGVNSEHDIPSQLSPRLALQTTDNLQASPTGLMTAPIPIPSRSSDNPNESAALLNMDASPITPTPITHFSSTSSNLHDGTAQIKRGPSASAASSTSTDPVYVPSSSPPLQFDIEINIGRKMHQTHHHQEQHQGSYQGQQHQHRLQTQQRPPHPLTSGISGHSKPPHSLVTQSSVSSPRDGFASGSLHMHSHSRTRRIDSMMSPQLRHTATIHEGIPLSMSTTTSATEYPPVQQDRHNSLPSSSIASSTVVSTTTNPNVRGTAYSSSNPATVSHWHGGENDSTENTTCFNTDQVGAEDGADTPVSARDMQPITRDRSYSAPVSTISISISRGESKTGSTDDIDSAPGDTESDEDKDSDGVMSRTIAPHRSQAKRRHPRPTGQQALKMRRGDPYHDNYHVRDRLTGRSRLMNIVKPIPGTVQFRTRSVNLMRRRRRINVVSYHSALVWFRAGRRPPSTRRRVNGDAGDGYNDNNGGIEGEEQADEQKAPMPSGANIVQRRRQGAEKYNGNNISERIWTSRKQRRILRKKKRQLITSHIEQPPNGDAGASTGPEATRSKTNPDTQNTNTADGSNAAAEGDGDGPSIPQIRFSLAEHPLRPDPSLMKKLIVAQSNKCIFCHTALLSLAGPLDTIFLGRGSGRARYCTYLGAMACTNCHTRETEVIPSRLLFHDDARAYPVANPVKNYLRRVLHSPIIQISSIDYSLYFKSPMLARARLLRQSLAKMLVTLKDCPSGVQVMTQVLGTNTHWAGDAVFSTRQTMLHNEAARHYETTRQKMSSVSSSTSPSSTTGNDVSSTSKRPSQLANFIPNIVSEEASPASPNLIGSTQQTQKMSTKSLTTLPLDSTSPSSPPNRSTTPDQEMSDVSRPCSPTLSISSLPDLVTDTDTILRSSVHTLTIKPTNPITPSLSSCSSSSSSSSTPHDMSIQGAPDGALLDPTNAVVLSSSSSTSSKGHRLVSSPRTSISRRPLQPSGSRTAPAFNSWTQPSIRTEQHTDTHAQLTPSLTPVRELSPYPHHPIPDPLQISQHNTQPCSCVSAPGLTCNDCNIATLATSSTASGMPQDRPPSPPSISVVTMLGRSISSRSTSLLSSSSSSTCLSSSSPSSGSSSSHSTNPSSNTVSDSYHRAPSASDRHDSLSHGQSNSSTSISTYVHTQSRQDNPSDVYGSFMAIPSFGIAVTRNTSASTVLSSSPSSSASSSHHLGDDNGGHHDNVFHEGFPQPEEDSYMPPKVSNVTLSTSSPNESIMTHQSNKLPGHSVITAPADKAAFTAVATTTITYNTPAATASRNAHSPSLLRTYSLPTSPFHRTTPTQFPVLATNPTPNSPSALPNSETVSPSIAPTCTPRPFIDLSLHPKQQAQVSQSPHSPSPSSTSTLSSPSSPSTNSLPSPAVASVKHQPLPHLSMLRNNSSYNSHASSFISNSRSYSTNAHNTKSDIGQDLAEPVLMAYAYAILNEQEARTRHHGLLTHHDDHHSPHQKQQQHIAVPHHPQHSLSTYPNDTHMKIVTPSLKSKAVPTMPASLLPTDPSQSSPSSQSNSIDLPIQGSQAQPTTFPSPLVASSTASPAVFEEPSNLSPTASSSPLLRPSIASTILGRVRARDYDPNRNNGPVPDLVSLSNEPRKSFVSSPLNHQATTSASLNIVNVIAMDTTTKTVASSSPILLPLLPPSAFEGSPFEDKMNNYSTVVKHLSRLIHNVEEASTSHKRPTTVIPPLYHSPLASPHRHTTNLEGIPASPTSPSPACLTSHHAAISSSMTSFSQFSPSIGSTSSGHTSATGRSSLSIPVTATTTLPLSTMTSSAPQPTSVVYQSFLGSSLSPSFSAALFSGSFNSFPLNNTPPGPSSSSLSASTHIPKSYLGDYYSLYDLSRLNDGSFLQGLYIAAITFATHFVVDKCAVCTSKFTECLVCCSSQKSDAPVSHIDVSGGKTPKPTTSTSDTARILEDSTDKSGRTDRTTLGGRVKGQNLMEKQGSKSISTRSYPPSNLLFPFLPIPLPLTYDRPGRQRKRILVLTPPLPLPATTLSSLVGAPMTSECRVCCTTFHLGCYDDLLAHGPLTVDTTSRSRHRPRRHQPSAAISNDSNNINTTTSSAAAASVCVVTNNSPPSIIRNRSSVNTPVPASNHLHSTQPKSSALRASLPTNLSHYLPTSSSPPSPASTSSSVSPTFHQASPLSPSISSPDSTSLPLITHAHIQQHHVHDRIPDTAVSPELDYYLHPHQLALLGPRILPQFTPSANSRALSSSTSSSLTSSSLPSPSSPASMPALPSSSPLAHASPSTSLTLPPASPLLVSNSAPASTAPPTQLPPLPPLPPSIASLLPYQVPSDINSLSEQIQQLTMKGSLPLCANCFKVSSRRS